MVLKFFVHIVKNLEPGILNTNSPSCNWSDHPRIYTSPDHSHWCFTYRIKTKLFHSSVLRSLISFILVCHLTPSPPHVISYVILCHAQLLVITCLRELYQTLWFYSTSFLLESDSLHICSSCFYSSTDYFTHN